MLKYMIFCVMLYVTGADHECLSQLGCPGSEICVLLDGTHKCVDLEPSRCFRRYIGRLKELIQSSCSDEEPVAAVSLAAANTHLSDCLREDRQHCDSDFDCEHQQICLATRPCGHSVCTVEPSNIALFACVQQYLVYPKSQRPIEHFNFCARDAERECESQAINCALFCPNDECRGKCGAVYTSCLQPSVGKKLTDVSASTNHDGYLGTHICGCKSNPTAKCDYIYVSALAPFCGNYTCGLYSNSIAC